MHSETAQHVVITAGHVIPGTRFEALKHSLITVQRKSKDDPSDLRCEHQRTKLNGSDGDEPGGCTSLLR